MIKCSKILFWFTVVVLVIWLLPWTYSFLTGKAHKSVFTLYSSVIDDFASIDQQDGKKIHIDRAGNVYTDSQFDSILPFFYYRQLIADEKFPEEMHGVALTPRFVQTENFMFRSTPSAVNKNLVPLYPLLESMSGRVDLVMPDDVFRITSKRMEFVDMESNQVDEEKSVRFTEALSKKGFTFPATIVSGNPTARKEYDEGYLVYDKAGKLFHLKQVKGRPYVRLIDVPEGLSIEHIFLTEFKNRRILAFITDSQQRLYALQAKSYEFKQVPIPSFNPKEQILSIIANAFDWTIMLSEEEADAYYAMDATSYTVIDQMKRPYEEESLAEKVGDIIFPVRLRFSSPYDREVRPRIN